MTGDLLRTGQAIVDSETVLPDEMRDDRVAVADMFTIIDDVGQLPARCRFRIEHVLMSKRQLAQLQEGKDLQPIWIVIGDPEQFGV
jgi:hypothetical protein